MLPFSWETLTAFDHRRYPINMADDLLRQQENHGLVEGVQ
jgi:hypothetical protein